MSKITKAQYDKALKIYASSANEADGLLKKRDAALVPLIRKTNQICERYNGDIDKHIKARDEAAATIEAYCTANKPVLFTEEKRSFQIDGFVIGFRKGTPKVILPNEKDKAAMAVLLAKLKRSLPEFVRTTEEIDKQAIGKNTNPKLQKKLLALDIEVKAEDTFYIKPA